MLQAIFVTPNAKCWPSHMSFMSGQTNTVSSHTVDTFQMGQNMVHVDQPMPHVGVDAITVGAEMIGALQTIISRKMAPQSGAVVSVTEFTSDGTRNVLAGKAVIKGDVRCRLPEDRAKVEQFMRQITSGIAAAHNVQWEMDFRTEFVEVINAEAPVRAVISAAVAEGLAANGARQAMSFSEDFAHFTNEVPGCFLLMGNGQSGAHAQPLHASDYDFNDALLVTGAQFWARLARQQLPVKR